MNKKYLTLTLIFFFTLSLFIRLYKLNLNLPELYADEVGHFYYYIWIQESPLKSIIDLLYNFTFRIFTFTWLLGLNPLGVRLPAAIFGSLIPIAVYFCFAEIDKKKNVALLASFLTIFLPWNFLISRIGHTHIPILILLTLIATHQYLKGINLKRYFIATTAILLSLYYYPSMFFIAPFFLVFITYHLFLNLNSTQQKIAKFLLTVTALLSIYIFLFLYKGLSSSSRGLQLAIWQDPNTIHDVNQFRGTSWLSTPSLVTGFLDPKNIAPFLYNKATANLSIFTRNYLSFFSPEWLFLKGDAILRHSTGQVGYFFPLLLPFLLFGLYRFFQTHAPSIQYLFLIWILTAPLAAAVTKDGSGYLLRAVTMLPFLTYLISLGVIDFLVGIKSSLPKKIFITGFSVLLFSSIYHFLFGYFQVYPYQLSTAHTYEYGFKDLAEFQNLNDNKTLLIVWDGYYPQYHFYFWQNLTLNEFQNLKFEDVVVGESHFYRSKSNLYFVKPYKKTDVDEFIKLHHPDYLVLPDRYYVNYPLELSPVDKQPEKTIYYPNQETNFTIYRL